VTILERRAERMRYLDEILPHVATVMADESAIRTAVRGADILIGAVHVPGARTPRLVPRSLVREMKPRSVIVDVAIDQGGACDTSHPTSHFKPTYVAEGILHYCVPNMPGAYGRTSTLALANSTLSYVLTLARHGLARALRESPALRKGVQCFDGRLVCRPVAETQNKVFESIESLIHAGE
jgi:alanine dehydrogenase